MSEILIQCVVVLYECTVEDSRTLQALAKFCRQQNDLARRIDLLLYDNSSHPQTINLNQWIDCGSVEYCHAKENGGLLAAYTEALRRARENGIDWLLLLDQDTTLAPTMFPVLFSELRSSLTPNICALVPKLMQNGLIISPQIVGRFLNHDCSAAFSGISSKTITAFNSAACLRVQALDAIGGFPRDYWLDFLDYIMFHRLQAAGGQVLILDITMEHHLSLRNLETEMSLVRYANVLASEWRFIRETGSRGGPLIHRLRLFKRAFGYSFNLKNKAYALITLRAILE
ncbi:MAG TPA: glycosyltransferase [Edaphobacter sp.]|nr:glycosyltransferase [Edaphobacter sp.]